MMKHLKLFATAIFALILYSGKSQDVRFELISEVPTMINSQNSRLKDLKDEICGQVDQIAEGVTKQADGSLAYPNWVKFVQIAEAIDSLNEVWNEAYGDALDQIIDRAISDGATDVAIDDEHGKDLLTDIIEEQHLIFPADIASVCFETKFDFNSLRKCLEAQEDNWLDSQNGPSFNPGNAPTLQEDLDDEYWTLITCDKRSYTILDNEVTPGMLDGMSEEQQRITLETIKDIVSILKDVVAIAETLHNILKDCAGTTTIKERDLKDGIEIPSEKSWIGIVMVQKGQAFDFGNKTITKIKGKAKLYSENKRGKRKRDRRNKASIGFCAKEWNNCENRDWPSDPGNYVSPHQNKRGKKTIKHREPLSSCYKLKRINWLRFCS